VDQFRQNLALSKESGQRAQQQLDNAQQLTWNQYLDAAVNPQPGKTITKSYAVPVPAPIFGGKPPAGVYENSKSPTGFSRVVQTVNTQQVPPITDPNHLVDFLVSNGQPKSSAIAAVKSRLRIPGWSYGKPLPSAKKG
jgi:hypothetical protein